MGGIMKYFVKIFMWVGYVGILALFLNASIAKAANIEVKGRGSSYSVIINGQIEKGDYSKFMDKLSQAFALSSAESMESFIKLKNDNPIAYKKYMEKYNDPMGSVNIGIWLNSIGGDVVEAMKIGGAVRDMLLPTSTGFYFVYEEKSEEKSQVMTCMSAGFFIWIAGVDRNAYIPPSYGNKSSLGIHRPYWDKEYFKNLSSEEAEREYGRLENTAKQYLQAMGLPDKYITKMFNVPSNEVYFLSEDEIDSLEGKIPYFEELLLSRCESFTKQEFQDFVDCFGHSQGFLSHEIERKCKALSPGYLDYLQSKIHETFLCWNTNWGIERWKRMSKYFSKIPQH
jgi:hypothetical protein